MWNRDYVCWIYLFLCFIAVESKSSWMDMVVQVYHNLQLFRLGLAVVTNTHPQLMTYHNRAQFSDRTPAVGPGTTCSICNGGSTFNADKRSARINLGPVVSSLRLVLARQPHLREKRARASLVAHTFPQALLLHFSTCSCSKSLGKTGYLLARTSAHLRDCGFTEAGIPISPSNYCFVSGSFPVRREAAHFRLQWRFQLLCLCSEICS